MAIPAKNHDLDGSVCDTSPVALLIIDVISPFDFDDADALLRYARPMAQRIAALKRRARAVGIPPIYVNDNFGKWRSDMRALIAGAKRPGCRGRELVELLEPDDEDYFVVKPKHSAFFNTTLDLLLEHLGAQTLILTGIASNLCVLFTASDAHMRDLQLVVPADCVAAADPDDTAHALEQMRRLFDADTTVSDELDLEALLSRGTGAPQDASPAERPTAASR